ncbi:Conserved oligomeric Golgi complex subunit 4 [Holothuria leucospilota]|uniref:Conserved oligomeric Golgi complex subunit 4 n=1 Tax=Holothuria leucospilota TaxID=206669 RepID=A0A9Q1HEA0_HOLLE|nr:Conserved oligomeric Golgi complex subunit 4 [Holothuria leucospilota]
MAAATSFNFDTANLQNLTEMKDIQEAYDLLCKEESKIAEEIDDLLDHQTNLESKMSSLYRSVPNLQVVSSDAKQLGSMVSFTSDLAENVSGKVRQLDLAKGRVQDAIQRVNDVLDLKFCTDGVQTALQSEDYEKAAGHIHRYLSLDEKVLKQITPDSKEGGSVDVALHVLQDAKLNLTKIVREKFDIALQTADRASVERFFKIFPLLGLHDEGLEKFSKYLKSQIADRCQEQLAQAATLDPADRRAAVVYADTLTILFEDVGKVVEIHQPLVETYYGPGRLLQLIQWLQAECDKQASKIVDDFIKHREFNVKSRQVQAFLHRGGGRSSTTHERLDPRDLDVMLAECTLLNSRTEMYLRFIRNRVMNDLESVDEDDKTRGNKTADLEKLLRECLLSRRIQELIGNYIVMEEYFMRESVTKAESMDSLEQGSHTSSMVDDIFFILKKCTKRAISSGSVDCACALLNHTTTILEGDYQEKLYSKLRAGFPSGSFDVAQAYSMLQQGRFPTSSSDTNAAKLEFMTTLNNIEVSLEYIQSLKRSLTEECAALLSQNKDVGKDKLESCLNDLGAVTHKFKDVLDVSTFYVNLIADNKFNGMQMVQYGLSQLSTSAIKPRLKPWVENFLSVNHNITEDEFSMYEANDPFVQNFIMNLEQLLAEFKDFMTASNYDALVSLVTNEVTTQLEQTVLRSVFNRLGGLHFDKELRSLVTYLTSVTQWTIRDKFARLTQMATILNLERVAEILDYWGQNSGPLTWRLTPTEVRQVLSLRVDFRSEDIKRLKL